MQQFTVPQFIDVEDKIIGPITARQFIILLSGFLIAALYYKLFDFTMFLILGILTLGSAGTIAFLKINGMPFHFFILNFFQTLSRPGLRIWNNSINKQASRFEPEEKKISPGVEPAPIRAYTSSRLSQLALMVDTQGAYKGEDENEEAMALNQK